MKLTVGLILLGLDLNAGAAVTAFLDVRICGLAFTLFNLLKNA